MLNDYMFYLKHTHTHTHTGKSELDCLQTHVQLNSKKGKEHLDLSENKKRL